MKLNLGFILDIFFVLVIIFGSVYIYTAQT